MQVSFEDSEEFLQAYAANTGPGGLLLATAEPFLEPGLETEVSFMLPGTGEEVRARARVVWRHEPGTPRGGANGLVGLSFQQIDDAVRNTIARFVESPPDS